MEDKAACVLELLSVLTSWKERQNTNRTSPEYCSRLLELHTHVVLSNYANNRPPTMDEDQELA
eukprot:1559245-Amphidinium_carterae.2